MIIMNASLSAIFKIIHHVKKSVRSYLYENVLTVNPVTAPLVGAFLLNTV